MELWPWFRIIQARAGLTLSLYAVALGPTVRGLVGWLFVSLVVCLFGCLLGWLVGCLVVCLFVWLVGYMCSRFCVKHILYVTS
jgi:hypothetical protein